MNPGQPNRAAGRDFSSHAKDSLHRGEYPLMPPPKPFKQVLKEQRVLRDIWKGSGRTLLLQAR